MKLVLFISSLFLLGCAQVTSLNLKKHQFGRIPTKIVWIQIAGLSQEHLALIKFSNEGQNVKTSFEKSMCVGSVWNYDLYNIRPKANQGFMGQLTGKKDLKNTCEDYRHKPIWSYLAKQNYKIGLFETQGMEQSSLLKSKSCKERKNYLDEAIIWRMSSDNLTKSKFHANEKALFKAGEVYNDKSCRNNNCFTSITRNIEATFNNFQKNTKNYLYIVQNYKYQNLLKKNKIKAAKNELLELNSVINYFHKKSEKSSDMLLIVTSSDAIDLSLPKAGKQWAAYEKSAKYVRKNTHNLLSPVYAFGARSENFCGIYEHNHLLTRIFSGAKQQGLEFSIINPFE